MKLKFLIILPLILSLGILIGHLMQVLASPGTPNPGHSVSQIGSGTFAEQGDYIFPGTSRIGIGTTDPGTNKLKVAGNTEITGNLNVSGKIYGTILRDYADKGSGYGAAGLSGDLPPNKVLNNDVFLVVTIRCGSGCRGWIRAKVDSSSPPTTIRGSASINYDQGMPYDSFTTPVKKGDYYQISFSGTGGEFWYYIYLVPIVGDSAWTSV